MYLFIFKTIKIKHMALTFFSNILIFILLVYMYSRIILIDKNHDNNREKDREKEISDVKFQFHFIYYLYIYIKRTSMYVLNLTLGFPCIYLRQKILFKDIH